jgi:IS66 Orf2 like protein
VTSGMLIPPGPVRVLVAMKPVDFRKGMNGLAAVVQEQLRADPFLCVGRDYVAEAA